MKRNPHYIDPRWYRWYPPLPNGEPNLNPWWAVASRRLNQWVRRVGWPIVRPRRYQELLIEQAQLAAPDEVSAEARARLGELLWTLGQDFPWRSTPEQAERRNAVIQEILDEILAGEAAEPDVKPEQYRHIPGTDTGEEGHP